jgi:hypothetical protein
MPKFLAGCHYNEKEISRHLKNNIRYWPVQTNGNKFATGQILRNPVEVVKGRILAGWAQKSPEPCHIYDTKYPIECSSWFSPVIAHKYIN